MTSDNAPYGALLAQRLATASAALTGVATTAPATTAGTVDLLESLLAHALDAEDAAPLWLVHVALAGAFPTSTALDDLRRRLTRATVGSRAAIALAETREVAAQLGDWDRPMRIVTGEVIVDVNFCARYKHNTGIQRVVREMIPHLLRRAGGAPVTLVAWTRQNSAMRSLDATETARVLRWGATGHEQEFAALDRELVVPWRSRVLLPEVAEPEIVERLACLAQHSGNLVSVLGYDMIPIGSADLVSASESERFARYLTVVKHADRVIAISAAVAEEFRGFSGALSSQGLTGPAVHHVSLAEQITGAAAQSSGQNLPLILCVGSHEPRKNQEAVLFAVERLHREGHEFRAVFLGGGSRTNTLPFDRRVRRLRDRGGLDVQTMRGIGDSELLRLYGEARFTVLVSLHEGFGLPIVESLSLGTPVLTSDYGSQAEIAAAGGCLTVDPRDDDAILLAMRRLLLDDALTADLRAQIPDRPSRSWADYAVELWDSAGMEVMP